MAGQFDDIAFVDARERQYFAEALLGTQTTEFLHSPVGRYLHGRAKLELELVRDELLEINPYSFFGRRRWKALKLRQAAAENFMRWCADAITEGVQAERKLEEYRE